MSADTGPIETAVLAELERVGCPPGQLIELDHITYDQMIAEMTGLRGANIRWVPGQWDDHVMVGEFIIRRWVKP